jgi:5-formaminoimidazole-4-carboxamide-1-beta-D-ribofuranosyl 5'-monophosphate synthetase
MKKKLIIGLLSLAIFSVSALSVNAQEKKKTEVGKALDHTGKAIGKGAKSVGNKTAEVAVKGSSKVADKTWKGKMAPDGSDVYINAKNEKYYVNAKGAKIWLKPTEIKTRVEKKN